MTMTMTIPAIAAVSIFALAMMTPIMATAPAAATATTTAATGAQETEATAATTLASSSSSGLQFSPQPILQERQISTGERAINQTHFESINSGNATLTLPNTTDAINLTSTGSVIVSIVDGTAVGKEVLTTLDGSESATAKFYGISRFGMEGGRAIVIALVNTNSTTGMLAPLNGMILVGQVEFPTPPEEAALLTLWEWQSGISLPPSPPSSPTSPPPPTEESSPLTETTTTTTATDGGNTTITITE